VLFPALSDRAPAQGERLVRVGVYDNRAIAVAYAPSRFNPVPEKMIEHERAKAAGDTARVEEFEAWGEALQRTLHRQAFGRVPVDGLLLHVADGLAEVASAKDLDLIARHCDHTASHVEIVDVTDDLVRLFEPSEKTLATVADLCKRDPIDLDEIDHAH